MRRGAVAQDMIYVFAQRLALELYFGFCDFWRAIVSFLPWPPMMYRKYQKIHEKRFLAGVGCLISARGTLLCGCRVLKRALLAEKCGVFLRGTLPHPGRTTPKRPVTPL